MHIRLLQLGTPTDYVRQAVLSKEGDYHVLTSVLYREEWDCVCIFV